MVAVTFGRAMFWLILSSALGIPVGMASRHLLWVQALVWFLLAIAIVTGFSGFIIMVARDSTKQERRQGQIIGLVCVAYAAFCVGCALGSAL